MENKQKISKNVVILGFVSFFNDIASEMIYPIVPIFLTSFLGVPVSIVGLIEGIAETTASLLKVYFGWLSDKFQKRKLFAVSGYSLSTISKLVIGLAINWPLVLVGRFMDRFGKGIRSSARDALIAENTTKENKGRSFGLHRGLDSMGAVVGPLIAILLLNHLGDSRIRTIFYLAFIPGLIGILLLVLFIKEKKSKPLPQAPSLRISNYSIPYKNFLFISIIFAIGNSSDAFLILKAKNIGLSTTTTILAYVLFNVVYSLCSFPMGILSDKIGARKILAFGFFLFALIYFLFGFNKSGSMIWILFALYGFYMALTEGIGKAYICQIVNKKTYATSIGAYQSIVGIGTFFSSLIAGILWSKINPSAPFYFGSILATIAAVMFVILSRNYRRGIPAFTQNL